jgi:hypothetical protein
MRKKCRRKVYPLLNSLAHGLAGAAISDDAALNKLGLCELSAIDSMTKGVGTPEDFRWLCDVINIGETMGKNGIGPEILPHCQEAQDELLKAAKRYQETKKMVLSGIGIRAIKEVWAYHEAQRTSVARSEYEKAIKQTANKIRSRANDVVEIT